MTPPSSSPSSSSLGRFIGGGVVINDGANNAASALTMPSALLRGDRRDDCDRDDDDNACDVHGPRRPRRVRCHKRGRRRGRGGSRRGHQRGRGKGAGGGRRKVRPLTVIDYSLNRPCRTLSAMAPSFKRRRRRGVDVRGGGVRRPSFPRGIVDAVDGEIFVRGSSRRWDGGRRRR